MRAPENTLLAFQLAVEAGADMIETDAHLAHDGTVVLIHDADLARTTNCTGSIGFRNVADLTACDAGYWFTPESAAGHPFRGTGLLVPSLADLFSLLEGLATNVRINVEIKNRPGDVGFDPDDRLAAVLVRQLKALGACSRVIVSSFNPASIDKVKDLDKSIRTAYLCTPRSDLYARTAYAVARGHDALHPHESSLPPRSADRTVRMMHEAGLLVNVWTVNNPQRWRELTEVGVDGIITDDPGGLRAALSA